MSEVKASTKDFLRHLLDVGPGGEGLFRTGDDDAADLLVFFGGLQRLGQLAQQLRVERVHGVGAVQRDEAIWSSISTIIVS
jgi:hypothetical protein